MSWRSLVMAYYEKPKGLPPQEDSLQKAKRQFYWQLFLHLMVPATILGIIFGVPVLIGDNLPDQLEARCTIYDSTHPEHGVRILSSTERLNTTRYYVTRDGGNRWENVYTRETAYRMARADCDRIIFNTRNEAAAVQVTSTKFLTVDFAAYHGAIMTDVSVFCTELEAIYPVYNQPLANFEFTCRAN